MTRLTNKTNLEIMNTEFSNLKIDESTRERVKQFAFRYRGSVRISSGRIYTDEEYEKRREKVLNTPLP